MSNQNGSPWSYSYGERGRTVTVKERGVGGSVYIRWPEGGEFDASRGYEVKSLGFAIREEDGRIIPAKRREAEEAAEDKYREMGDGGSAPVPEDLTLKTLFNLYDRHDRMLRRKYDNGDQRSGITQKTRRQHQKLGEAWMRFLGPDTPADDVDVTQVEDYANARAEGTIGHDGTPETANGPVGPTTVAHDIKFIGQVYRWAMPRGHVDQDPTATLGDGGVKTMNRDPEQPVLTPGQWRKIREKAREMAEQDEGRTLRSYLWPVLELLAGTGRRVGAVVALRWEDVRPGPEDPQAILWPSETDKARKGSDKPIRLGPGAREAIERVREARGPSASEWLFPAPRGEGHVGYDTLRPYLTKVVERAKVDVGDRFGFHAWRRMVVTQFLEQGWSAKHVGDHVGMTAEMVLEVYGHPTQDSHRQMADSLAWD